MSLLKRFLHLALPSELVAEYSAAKEEAKIDAIAQQAMRAKAAAKVKDGETFMVGRFAVTADNGWNATIKADDRLLLNYRSDGDHHTSYVQERTYSADPKWMKEWDVSARSFTAAAKKSSPYSPVTVRLP